MENTQASAIPCIKGGKIAGVTKLAIDTLKLATKIKKAELKTVLNDA